MYIYTDAQLEILNSHKFKTKGGIEPTSFYLVSHKVQQVIIQCPYNPEFSV